MKNNVRRLNAILKLFHENAWYVVSIDGGGVKLQGRHNTTVSRKLNSLKFKATYDADNGWAEFTRPPYYVTLTT